MEPLSKMSVLKLRDTRRMQPYMNQKSIANSRLEFLWQTHMIETRMNMKGKYPKDKYQCPHCPDGDLRPPAGVWSLQGPEGGDRPRVCDGRQSLSLRKVIQKRTALEKLL